MKTKQLTLIAEMTTQPGTEQIFLDHVHDLVAKTRAESGCINYYFHQHKSDPNRFVFYENFVDQAAFDLHYNQPYTQEWVALGEAHGATFDLQFWTIVSKPD